jgi:hypothetical protein
MRLPLSRERRTEESRAEELQQLLSEIEPYEILAEREKAEFDDEGVFSSFRASIERRAADLGMTPEQLLTDYGRRLRESTYPTPECLQPEDVQAMIDTGARTPEQAIHIEACQPCKQLLVKASSPIGIERILAKIHASEGKEQPADSSTVEAAVAGVAHAATKSGTWRLKDKIASVGQLLRR